MPRSAFEPIRIPDWAWKREETLNFLRARDAGAFFRFLRQYGGASQIRIAAATGLAQGRVSEVVRGIRQISGLHVWERIAAGVGMPDHARIALGLVPQSMDGRGEHGGESLTVQPLVDQDQRSRNGARAGWSWSPVGLGGDDLLEYLRTTRKQYVRADWLLGPQHILPAVVANLELVRRVLPDARRAMRRHLLDVGARYAELAGWLYQDIGDLSTALAWSDRAMEWAQENGQHQLVAYILFRKSNQAADQRSSASTIGLAEAVRRTHRSLTRPVLALSLRQEAYGYALNGDERTCHHRLDAALTLAIQSQRDGDEGPGDYCDEAYVESLRAYCWLELGKPQRAIEVFEQIMPGWPRLQQRDRGLACARLALAQAQAENHDQAVTQAREALNIAFLGGSGRILRDLQRVGDSLARWRTVPGVAELLADLLPSRSMLSRLV